MSETAVVKSEKIQATKATNVFLIDPTEIVVDQKQNGRSAPHADGDVDLLVQSFERSGQLQPVVARKNKDNKLELVFGFCRHAAALKYNEKHPDKPMKLRVEVQKLDDVGAFERNLSENLRRKMLSIVDIAQAQKRLSEEFSWKDKEIAKFFNMTTSYVCQLRKILTLRKKWLNLLHVGALAVGVALKMAELPHEEQEALYKKLKAEDVLQEAENAQRQERKAEIEAEETGTRPVASTKKKPKVNTGEALTEIRQAAQRTQEETGSDKPPTGPIQLTRKQFVEYLESKTGPAENAVLRQFVESLLEFYSGKISEKKMDKRIDALFPPEK